MQIETVHGIEYKHPQVILLQETGIGTSEYAARTCYDSFALSENTSVQNINSVIPKSDEDWGLDKHQINSLFDEMNSIEHSDLLDQLAWTHFHHSILEHANLTYLIKGTNRGTLQEHARHRIQAISVRSTRYTMSSVINAFVASTTPAAILGYSASAFIDKMHKMDILVTTDKEYNTIEYRTIFSKLLHQQNSLGREEFIKIGIAKSSIPTLSEDITHDELFELLEAGKKKRNVGDAFKHIITDNFKTDMVVTMNLRALKNYLTLRDSGAAYFQIRWLAQAMKEVTPKKYLDLIIKD